MSKPVTLALLLSTTALLVPGLALAQAQGTGAPTNPGTGQSVPVPNTSASQTPGSTVSPDQAGDQAGQTPDVSIPGGSQQNSTQASDVVVTGRRTTNLSRTSPQVVSVLSSADIARTGEGNIAGSLSRVTGLSVVGSGFVYVRGLGDRYSLALLNGSPLPSPDPNRRVIPLDIFPTSVIASSLVQKSYSVNFPGEYGGGVVNLTTIAAPTKPFLSVGAGLGADTETTNKLGYTYFGSTSDYLGYTTSERSIPPALQAYLNSGRRISQGGVDTQAIASQLVTGRNSVVQRNRDIPPNWNGTVTGGTAFDLGGATFGIVANAGYSNAWRTRQTTQQTPLTADLSQVDTDFNRVITDDRVIVNGLLGLSLTGDTFKARLTNLYVHDTIKEARLGVGTRSQNGASTLEQQDTAFFERQLIDSQFAGEWKPVAGLEIDLRGSYANSKRSSPDEFSYEYARTNDPNDPYGQYFINRLNNGNRGNASVSFSSLNEDLYSFGADLSYKIIPQVTATVGYAYLMTDRKTERRDFQFVAPTGSATAPILQLPTNSLPNGIALLRPDYLLQPAVINNFGITLIDSNEGNPAFRSRLWNHAGYGQLQLDVTPKLSLNTGVRYEKGLETVVPIQVFTTPTASLAPTRLDRDYWLPAATITYAVRPDMQVRVSGSKTIARPQFRELIFQAFYDPETNRNFQGNPLLVDSQLYNAEARYEWYFGRDQRFAVAGFYKRIDHPIETYAFTTGNGPLSSFVNAPRADLYGGEAELQKYFDIGSFLPDRRIVTIANYTFTKSRINVREGDTAASVLTPSATSASDYVTDGRPLTGQSDHVANLELGLEAKDHLSQQTLLLNYASKRVTNRGVSGLPDVYEYPGFHLDFVAREGVTLAGTEFQVKFEARNLTGRDYREYERSGDNRIYFNRFDVGRSFFFAASVGF